MARIKWIKLEADMFSNKKINYIRTLPEGNNILLIWIMLLTMAGTCNSNGYIFLTENIPYSVEMLAKELRFETTVIRVALQILSNLKMVELTEDTLMICGWEDHQNVEGMEKVKEQTRKRVAKHRENQKQLECNGKCNVTVTDSNGTEEDIEEDIEREVEKEEEREKDKEKNIEKKETLKTILCAYAQGELLEVLQEFVKLRKTLKKPLTPRALKMILNDLDKLTSDVPTKIAIVEQSIKHSWQGVFQLKSTNTTNNTKATPAHILNKPEGVGMFD